MTPPPKRGRGRPKKIDSLADKTVPTKKALKRKNRKPSVSLMTGEQRLHSLVRTVKELSAELARKQNILQFARNACFPKQLEFLDDPAKQKILFCSRRSGKTYLIALFLLQEALNFEKRRLVYFGITKKSAKKAIWRDILQPLLDEFKITYHFHTNDNTITFLNGSTIEISGLDITEREVDRTLGQKLHACVIDEVQSLHQDLIRILGKLEPALLDQKNQGGGYVILAGTPGMVAGGDLENNPWWHFTMTEFDGSPAADRTPGWSVHSWGMADNPKVAREFEQEKARRLALHGQKHEEDPIWQREWLGRWVIDPGLAVYKYDPRINALLSFTPQTQEEHEEFNRQALTKHSILSNGPGWQYLLGVDIGWEDACAFVLGAYSQYDNKFYVIESQAYNHSVVSRIAQTIQDYRKRFTNIRVFVDTGGLGKVISETIMQQYRIPVYAANKVDKAMAVGVMNSDFLAGSIRVFPETNAYLIEEWNNLILDQSKLKSGQWKEHKKKPNHLADACLYIYRESQHFLGKPIAPKPTDDLQRHFDERDRTTQQKDIFSKRREDRERAKLVAIFRDKGRKKK